MKRFCVAGVLATLCAQALADWTQVGGVENIFSAYADPDTIERRSGSVRMWGIYDFHRPDMSIDGQQHHSTKVLREFDCGERRVRLLSFIDFSERMGAGRAIASGEDTRNWEPIVPGAVDEAFWRIACGT